MSRRPITEMAALTKKGLLGYEAIWAHMLKFGGDPFTLRHIVEKTSAHPANVRDYLKRLVRAGYAEETAELHGKAKLYRLLKTPGKAPRLQRSGQLVEQGAGRAHMWRSIKMMGVFTTTDLAIAASTESVSITEVYARDYVRFLKQAGYLKVVQPHQNRKSKASYRLLKNMNTGPRAPVVQRIKAVYDPNLNRVMWPVTEGGMS